MLNLLFPKTDEPLSVILKLPGDVCNINCHYCYEKRKPTKYYNQISPDLLRKFLSKAGGRSLSLELHGGEPLIIGKSKMRSLLQVCRDYEGTLRIVLQTNATLLDQEWLDLFREEWPEMEFSTSIDGDPASTKHRVDYKDNPIHNNIERVFKLVSKNNMKLGVICTVTRSALGRESEILNYFLQFPAINMLKLNPCFDFNVTSKRTLGNNKSLELYNPVGIGVPGWGIEPLEFSTFLKEFFELWVLAGSYTQLLVEPFLSIIRVLGGSRSNFCVYDLQKCSSMLTLYPDGRIASCDELNMPESLLSSSIDNFNSLDDIVHYQTNQPLHESLNELFVKCSTCDYKKICNGGCLATRKRYRDSELYEQYCQYRIQVIEHISNYLNR